MSFLFSFLLFAKRVKCHTFHKVIFCQRHATKNEDVFPWEMTTVWKRDWRFSLFSLYDDDRGMIMMVVLVLLYVYLSLSCDMNDDDENDGITQFETVLKVEHVVGYNTTRRAKLVKNKNIRTREMVTVIVFLLMTMKLPWEYNVV